tara:strand:+ start:618 stop:998 length:381 start_codon:yes stop_codon:yes gene_type:complete
MSKTFFFIILNLNFLTFNVNSIEPNEILLNKELEQRAREISKKLRCLVCQNEDIDNSNADIAKDLRLLLREKLTDGETDKEIIDFIHSKYGDYILYSPPIKTYTLILWLAPFIFLLFFSMLFFKKK